MPSRWNTPELPIRQVRLWIRFTIDVLKALIEWDLPCSDVHRCCPEDTLQLGVRHQAG